MDVAELVSKIAEKDVIQRVGDLCREEENRTVLAPVVGELAALLETQAADVALVSRVSILGSSANTRPDDAGVPGTGQSVL